MKKIFFLPTLRNIILIVLIGNGCNTKNGNTDIGTASQDSSKVNTVAVATPAVSPTSSVEELGKALFEAVKSNDYAAYSNLIPSADELAEILDTIATTAEQKKHVDSVIHSLFKTMLANSKTNFDAIIAKGDSAGVIWNSAQFDNADYSIKKEKGLKFAQNLVNSPVVFMTIKLNN